jgi:hypothetical protein
MTDAADDRRRARRVEIEARLRRVRGAMTDAEFERLVSAVVRTAERFDDINAGTGVGWHRGSSQGEPEE